MLARFQDLDTTFSVFDRLFDNIGYAPPSPESWRRLSVTEKDDALHVSLDVPGLNEKDLSVAIHEGVLTIRGEKKTTSKDEEKVVRAAGLKFEKSFTLPYDVDTEGAHAAVKDGILSISLPKIPVAKPKEIAVTAKAE
ncbi:MAG: Hsp20/alpha crystallin family protein [Polyangiaceae bacterium]